MNTKIMNLRYGRLAVVLLLAATGCNQGHVADANPEQEQVMTEKDSSFVLNFKIFDQRRQDYEKFLSDYGEEVESYYQGIGKSPQQADSVWQAMYEFCTKPDLKAAYNFYKRNKGLLQLTLFSSDLKFEFDMYVVRPLLEKFETEEIVYPEMVKLLELDKLNAEMAMYSDRNRNVDYVPEHYYEIIKYLAEYYMATGKPKDSIMPLVADYRYAFLAMYGNADAAESCGCVLEHAIHYFYGDMEDAERCRLRIHDLLKQDAIDRGEAIDEEWEKKTEEFLDELLM